MTYILCPYCDSSDVQITGEARFGLSHPANGSEFGWTIGAVCKDDECYGEVEVKITNEHLLEGQPRIHVICAAAF